MKGKIFKRVASAMLGLMFMFTAFEMKGFAVDEVDVDQTTATIILTNFHNDGIAAGDKCYFDVHAKLDAKAEANKGKNIKITDWAFHTKVTEADIDDTKAENAYFTRAFGVAGVDGQVKVDGSNHTVGYIYNTTNSPLGAQEMIIQEGKEVNLGTMQLILKQKKNDKDELTFAPNADITVEIKNSKTNKTATEATNVDGTTKNVKFTLCAHADVAKITYTDINAKTHTMNCGTCNTQVVQDHVFDQGNEQTVAPDATKLGGKWRKCKCGLEGYSNLARLAGTTPLFMPNGKTNISAYEALNQIAVDIEGHKVIVQDGLNKFNGKKLVLTATEATADSAVRKALASKISANGKIFTFTLTADGEAVKADDIKEGGIRVLYQLPAGIAYNEYVQLLKDAGVTGDFGAEAEKINNIDYVAVWTKTAVGPYVLPNGAAAAAGTNGANKTTTTSTSGKSAKTGDAAGMVCLAASGLLVVAGLYMELMKKKKNA